ncbi:MAG TPA: BON domain-containing protein [Legionella sp.]|nr:BON domain-containing protein [Legionella sp.]
MRNYLYTVIAGLILLLAGCSTTNTGNIFHSVPSGMTLTQSVQDALAGSDDPVIAQIHVETNQNVVTLSGYVRKIRQSDTAEQITREVPGVQSVENHLIVRQ